MPPRLIIRFLPDGQTEWMSLGRDGRVLFGPQPGLPHASEAHLTVLVPGEDVLLLRTPRVSRHRGQLERAVPFAIEDQLAAPVELLHVALEAGGDQDALFVAAVRRERMDAWITTLRAAGLEPDALVPDLWLLPDLPTTISALYHHGRVLARSGTMFFAGGVDEFEGWLSLLGPDVSDRSLHCYGELPAIAAGTGARRVEALDAPLPWLAGRLAEVAGLNLMQGGFRPDPGRDGAGVAWRRAAIAASIAVLLALGAIALERNQLINEESRVRAEMEQLLLESMPGTTRIVDPRAQLAGEFSRASSRAGGGALPLLAQVAPVLQGSGMHAIDGLEFRGDTLELVVRTRDVASLDALREALSRLPALRVELSGLTPGSGGVEGRLVVRSGA